jgi:TetR/AcrR family transcriptional regulator, transcriptional repressor for nem operon
MSRPREFDEQQALQQAKEVFWQRGYEATSLADLLAAMGLSKSSFYETFGSKRELFLRSLARYREERVAEFRQLLAGGKTARRAIEVLFRSSIVCETHKGCMACNEAVELAGRDADAELRVAAVMAALEELLVQAIARGQDEGSIGTRLPPADLARLLMVALNGLQIEVRACAEQARLEQTVDVVMRMLD